jgi:hypothetical protein
MKRTKNKKYSKKSNYKRNKRNTTRRKRKKTRKRYKRGGSTVAFTDVTQSQLIQLQNIPPSKTEQPELKLGSQSSEGKTPIYVDCSEGQSEELDEGDDRICVYTSDENSQCCDKSTGQIIPVNVFDSQNKEFILTGSENDVSEDGSTYNFIYAVVEGEPDKIYYMPLQFGGVHGEGRVALADELKTMTLREIKMKYPDLGKDIYRGARIKESRFGREQRDEYLSGIILDRKFAEDAKIVNCVTHRSRNLNHPCLTGGKRVICAGHFMLTPTENKIVIDNTSGHYLPGTRNLPLVKQIFDANLEGWNVTTEAWIDEGD